ncbi:MAG TPA: ABC transporter permease [Armatimonadota bacterium]|nr:ABC transporter permease [Armatimonadota bacterium]
MRFLREATRTAGLGLLAALGIALLAGVLVACIVAALGGNPAQALAAIVQGAAGSPDSLAETLVRSTPLVFTGLSVAVAFRCGIWNIGAEGQFLAGMLGSALAALLLPPLPAPLGVPAALLAGTFAGALWSAVPAALKLRRDVPEVISTIMMNFLAVYLIEYLVRGPLKDPQSASDWSRPLPEWSRLPRLSQLGWPAAFPQEFGRLHAGVLLSLLVVAGVWLWLARTGTGFRIRAVGLNPAAAAAAGMPVARTLFTAFVASGALAGLGGAVEQLGMIARLHRYLPGEPGYGFSAIAVALLGQLHPLGTLASALFFGALAAGCDRMQRAAGVSFQVAYVIEAALVLLLIALPQRMRARAGKAAAEPSA